MYITILIHVLHINRVHQQTEELDQHPNLDRFGSVAYSSPPQTTHELTETVPGPSASPNDH
jgi:hypothetical protein